MQMRLKEDTMSQMRHYNNPMRIKETHGNYANQKQIQERVVMAHLSIYYI